MVVVVVVVMVVALWAETVQPLQRLQLGCVGRPRLLQLLSNPLRVRVRVMARWLRLWCRRALMEGR